MMSYGLFCWLRPDWSNVLLIQIQTWLKEYLAADTVSIMTDTMSCYLLIVLPVLEFFQVLTIPFKNSSVFLSWKCPLDLQKGTTSFLGYLKLALSISYIEVRFELSLFRTLSYHYRTNSYSKICSNAIHLIDICMRIFSLFFL